MRRHKPGAAAVARAARRLLPMLRATTQERPRAQQEQRQGQRLERTPRRTTDSAQWASVTAVALAERLAAAETKATQRVPPEQCLKPICFQLMALLPWQQALQQRTRKSERRQRQAWLP